jgi:hypothetical protein
LSKKSQKSTKIAQEMTKSARFLQKNHKKYQFFTIFPPQIDLRFVETRNLNTQPT